MMLKELNYLPEAADLLAEIISKNADIAISITEAEIQAFVQVIVDRRDYPYYILQILR